LRGFPRADDGTRTDGEWHRAYELAAVAGHGFHCCLYCLRRRGWQINSRQLHGKVFEYRLEGRISDPPERPRLSQPQLAVLHEFSLAVERIYGQDGLGRVVAALPPRLQEEARKL
jgi:hypothetical protein